MSATWRCATRKDQTVLRISDRTRDTLGWIALIAIVLFSVLRTQAINSNLRDTQEQQQVDRCVSGQELRDATRANIKAVYALAVGAVQPPTADGGPPLTPEQQSRMDRYLEVAKTFRDDALAKVPPVSPGCEDIKEEDGSK